MLLIVIEQNIRYLYVRLNIGMPNDTFNIKKLPSENIVKNIHIVFQKLLFCYDLKLYKKNVKH